MSDVEKPYAIIQKWWHGSIGADNSAARALAAQLRRASGPVEILSHEAVFELGEKLKLLSKPLCLAMVAGTIAHVRENRSDRLAQLLGAGGEKPAMNKLRFEKLVRSPSRELAANMRRALAMVDGRCNVGALGEDLMFWNEEKRIRWFFDYLGAMHR